MRTTHPRPDTISLVCLVLAGSAVLSEAKARGEEALNLSGYLTTRTGKTITFTKVHDLSKFLCFRYGPEDKETTFPLSQVQSVVFGEESASALICLKDGRRVQATRYGTDDRKPIWGVGSRGYHCEHFYLFYFDDIARKEQQRNVYFSDISRLVLDENVGRFRRCTHCRGTWPDSYLFCPHDGVRTVWGESSGSLLTVSEPGARERTKRTANLMEALLNASLARSGVDPTSDEAAKAKEFGKLWMNPLADPKEIHRKLDEFREEWRKKAGGQ